MTATATAPTKTASTPTLSTAPPVRVVQPPTVPPARPGRVRSPVDVLRVLVGLLIIFVGLTLANLIDSAFLGLAVDTGAALSGVPQWFYNLLAVGVGTLVAAAIVGSVAWAAVTTRYRRLVVLIAALGASAGLSIIAGHLALNMVDPDVSEAFRRPSSLLRFSSATGVVHPGDPLLAAAVALTAVGTNFLRSRALRWSVQLLVIYAVVITVTTHVPAVGLLVDIGIGLTVGAVALLLAGRRNLAPKAGDLTDALARIGIQINGLRRLNVDARGSAPWMGRRADGSPVFVKALGRDERSADLMFRLYRWAKLRRAGDHRPFVSLRRSVEHEALVSLQAAALGVATPKILGVSEAGIDGMALAYEGIEGASADSFDDLSDESLEAIWRMVSCLHSRRIAHRDLRLANIFIAESGQPMLIDFGFSELAASDQLLGTDAAELLASTAALVGTERAVAAAHRATGLDELTRILPWLQPSALSNATRSAIGGAKGLVPIRQMLIEQCGVKEEAPVKLHRIEPKLVFGLVTVALSAWFLLPQLADIGNIWANARNASVPWSLAAVALSVVTYLAATTALLGAIPNRLAFGPAFAAQLASSFANRVTPAKVGGVATNIRYFQHQGVPTAVSVTAVGVNAIAGLIMHVTLTVTFLVLSSSNETSSLPLPQPQVILIAVLGILAVVAVSYSLPVTRRLLSQHVVPHILAGVQSLRTIGQSFTRLSSVFGGSALITLAYLGAMIASLQAFGSTASLAAVGVLFLTGSAVANAAPTPGGLGAAEAALIAALLTVEDAEIVVPAVFLYRLVTFWLPILPGWIALAWLRKTERI